ncbi:hypothetical protein Swit_2205 [Rhizorhabdus wittichii RW1]|uniref:Uncharacterized protein n=1 Tax=Rhizorhabdus wittichii (strain DSM 6014 / CCUG 31198 / JCM 15750 / NBRC 105917 / EY 4224 / RW1) TaxID=392499 RepID=A0A9J9HBW7_RHIWR|nr:hypothetical protein Swit_2205 [Rhizorhabdus wittichii RW1]
MSDYFVSSPLPRVVFQWRRGMTAHPTRYAIVAATLTPGQLRALRGIPLDRPFIPEHTGFQWPTLARLKAERLINAVKDGTDGWGKAALHVITDRGRRVREAAEGMA